jgi:hypothetical protein
MLASSTQLDAGIVPATKSDGKPRVVVPPPLPTHPFGPPESDAPRSARVRLQVRLSAALFGLSGMLCRDVGLIFVNVYDVCVCDWRDVAPESPSVIVDSAANDRVCRLEFSPTRET